MSKTRNHFSLSFINTLYGDELKTCHSCKNIDKLATFRVMMTASSPDLAALQQWLMQRYGTSVSCGTAGHRGVTRREEGGGSEGGGGETRHHKEGV